MEPGKFYEPFEGYLWKRGEHGLRTWKKRFFSLRQNILYYYDEQISSSGGVPQTKSNLPTTQQQAQNPKGRIILAESQAIQPSEGISGLSEFISGVVGTKRSSTRESDPEIPSYFEIKTPGRIYYLCAASQSEMNRWINALKYSKDLYSEMPPRLSVNANIDVSLFPSESSSTPSSTPSAPPLTDSVLNLLENKEHLPSSSSSPFANNTYGDAYLYHSPYSSNSSDSNNNSSNTNNQQQQQPPSSSSSSSSYFPYYFENPSQNNQIAQSHASSFPPIVSSSSHVDITDKYIKEINFTEGEVASLYTENLKLFFSIIADANIQKGELASYRKRLSVYLLLSILHADNFSYFSTHYAQERIYVKLVHCIETSRNSILQNNRWKLEAPTTITQIDTWIKRRRSANTFRILRGDKESLFNLNTIAIHFIRKNLSDSIDSDLHELLSQTLDVLISEVDSLPRKYFPSLLHNSFDISKLPKEFSNNVNNMNILKDFLEISFVLQKLKLENDESNTTKRDPYLHNLFEQILSQLNVVSNSLIKALQAIQSDLRTTELKIFGTWKKEFSLLHSNIPELKTDHYSLLLKNERILKRLGVKAHKFQKLQESLFMCAIGVAERMPKIENSVHGEGEETLLQIVQMIRL